MKTVADTRIAFKHAETDRIHTRGFAHPAMGVDLPALHADLHREFAHGPRDQTLILFDFKKPAISGYRGEVACDTPAQVGGSAEGVGRRRARPAPVAPQGDGQLGRRRA